MADQDLDYKKLVEAALFMSPKAVGVDDLVSLTGIAFPGRVEKIVKELVQDYSSKDTALEVVSIDGKYMFSLKEQYAGRVKGLANEPDISRGALRILAYVSKNEKTIQSDLVKYFGSSVYDYMKELQEKEFVETRKYKRSKLVLTTPKFREYFNVSAI